MGPDPVQDILEFIDDGDRAGALDRLNQLLREEPYQGGLLALRAMLLSDMGRGPVAADGIREALEVSPEHPFVHYAAAAVALRAGEMRDAIAAAVEAQRLATPYPEAAMLEARARVKLGQWAEVVRIAHEVLAVDPEYDEAAVLAQAAVSAGADTPLDGEAWEELSRRFPLNATARAANGWSRIQSGRARDARGEFEQALALDGSSTFAREGLVIALKARSPLYSVLLRFFIWSERLPLRTQQFMAIGGVLGYNFLRRLSRSQPELAPVIVPVLVAYALFVLATWLADPLLNLTLLTDRESRQHLSTDDRNSGLAVGACLAFASLLGLGAYLFDAGGLWLAAIPIAMASFPVAGHYATQPSGKRDRLGIAAVAIVVLGLLSAVGPAGLAGFAFGLALLLAVASTWYARFGEARPQFRESDLTASRR